MIRSDSSVALAMTKRLSSPHPSLNFLAAELVLRLEKNQVLTEWADNPPGLEGVHFKRTATWKAHRFWLKAPGDATAESWESFTPQDVIFDHFTAR